MRNFIIYLGILILTSAMQMFGQETFEAQAKEIANRIEKITKEEKALLKFQVEEVNKELQKGVLNQSQADEKKLKLAESSAARIEQRISEEEVKLTALVKEKVEGRIAYLDTNKTKDVYLGKGIKIHIKSGLDTSSTKNGRTTHYLEKRTTSQLVFATGINNLVTNKAIANSDFRYLGSHFYELGWTQNTRIFKNDNFFHFKYGFSVQYNNLRATDNRYFKETGNQTTLQVASNNLKDSRLRNVNLVLPLYLEFDTSQKKMINDKSVFKIHQGVRFGLGGFVGTNIKTKQILKFEQNGNDVTVKEKGDFNVNDFVYGLGAYVGYKDISLYAKYDLNPLFENNTIDQNNISFGVRFDLN